VTRKQIAGAAQRSKPPTVGRSSLQSQFEERLRIAERIVQALREAGHSCGLAVKAYSLNDIDLPTRH
jgi:regulator of protease activity HflC (stomatin/prohibitin superfamily)